MTKAGLVNDKLKSSDKHRNVVGLTEEGKVLAEKMLQEQFVDIDLAVENLLAEANYNLWEAVAEWEFLLEQKSLLKLVQEYILDKGGKILVALYKDEPLGVCALIKMKDKDYDFEMAKMAVSPKAQGKNIGWLLGQSIINSAKELGASKLYLESNTILKPAINLYYKLGFVKISGRPTPYQRANIQMELDLKK